MRNRERRRSWAPLMVVGLFIGAGLLAACGSSSSSSSGASAQTSTTAATTTGGAASATGGVSQAKALVAQYERAPTTIPITEPLNQKPAAGKRIGVINCGVAVCQEIYQQIQQAGAMLHWTVTQYPAGTTPEQLQQAWQAALSASPKLDGIVTSGYPESEFAAQLARAKSLGIPVVDHDSGNSVGNGIIAESAADSDDALRASLQADYVVAATNGKANALVINTPAFPTTVVEQKSFLSQLHTLCPSCQGHSLEFSIGSSDIPSAVVSFLQRNPDVNYVVFVYDDIEQGVAQAMRVAGLHVPIAGNNGAAVGMTNLNSGIETVDDPEDTGYLAYKIMDTFARKFEGSAILPTELSGNLTDWLMTKATYNPNWYGPPGYAAAFGKLWHLS